MGRNYKYKVDNIRALKELRKIYKKCTKCSKNKIIKDFPKRKELIDGHRNICKECDIKRRKALPKKHVEEKTCSKCNITKPVDAFRKTYNSKDGYSNICNECADKTYLKTCVQCGKEFYTHHIEAKTCSSTCNGLYQQRRIYFNCDYCGKESYERETEYNRYKNHYCSLECKDKHRSILYVGENAPMYGKEGVRGENHPRYNPNLTDEEREQGRFIDGYYRFIQDVYKRDNYTCQCCGKPSNGDIVAHHLNGYNWYKEGRTEVSNAITLCEECHNSFHNMFGRGDNTKEQFEEYLKIKKKELEEAI